MKELSWCVLAVLALCLIPSPAQAQVIANMESGSVARIYADITPIGKDKVRFIWEPDLPIGTSAVALTASCLRVDLFGFPLGSHKATFSKIQLIGFDTETVLNVKNLKVKVKKGETPNPPLVEITSEVQSRFADDELIVVVANLKVTGNADFFDQVTCLLGVMEVDDTALRGLGEAERAEALRTVVEQALPAERSRAIR